MDLNFNLITEFGNGGKATVDFGQNEFMDDFALDENGDLYCTGTRRDGDALSNSRIIAFKLDATTGSLIDSFGVSGFKEYVYLGPNGTEQSKKGFIGAYNGNYIIAGRNYGGTTGTRLVTVNVDNDGNTIPGYGVGGYKMAELFNFGNYDVVDLQVVGNRVYGCYSYLVPGGGAPIDKVFFYDLDNNSTNLFDDVFCSSINVYDDGIFVTKRRNYVSTGYGGNAIAGFTITKFTFAGEIDPTFNNDGNFIYYYQDATKPDEIQAMTKDANGNIFFVGCKDIISSGNSNDFLAVRIRQATLSTTKNTTPGKSVSVYPNPFDHQITIESGEQITALEIDDLTGRKIAMPALHPDGNAVQVDLSEITQSGVYILQVTSGNKKSTQKIIRK